MLRDRAVAQAAQDSTDRDLRDSHLACERSLRLSLGSFANLANLRRSQSTRWVRARIERAQDVLRRRDATQVRKLVVALVLVAMIKLEPSGDFATRSPPHNAMRDSSNGPGAVRERDAVVAETLVRTRNGFELEHTPSGFRIRASTFDQTCGQIHTQTSFTDRQPHVVRSRGSSDHRRSVHENRTTREGFYGSS